MGWISTSQNIADALTRIRDNARMEELLDKGILNIDISQWILINEVPINHIQTSSNIDTTDIEIFQIDKSDDFVKRKGASVN